MKDRVLPKLARKCCSVEDSDNGDEDDYSASSDGSLEILSPQQEERSTNNYASLSLPPTGSQSSDDDDDDKNNNQAAKASTRNNSSNQRATYAKMMVDLSDDSSSDDDDGALLLLSRSKPTFATSHSLSQSSTNANIQVSHHRLATRKRPHPKSMTQSSRTSSEQETKEEARERRKQERAQKKRETDRRKQLEKLAREQKKDRDKAERSRQKEFEKQTKQREKDENQQASGKFSKDEILLLIDPSLHRNNEYGIVAALEEDFTIKEYEGPLESMKTIQWVRKDYLEGGAEDAWRCMSEGKMEDFIHIPYLLVIVDYLDYIPLIERIEHDLDDDYPKLGKWLSSLMSRWKSVWSTTQEPRVILMLDKVAEDLDREWTHHRRRKKDNPANPSLPSDWELQDSLQWLLIQFQVDCIKCSTNEEIQVNVHKLTRGLAEAPYSNHATELECVRKIKPAAGLGEDPFSKAQDTWLRQLQMIPKISEQRARHLVQHYPTLQSLWQAYQAGDDRANPGLLCNCFGGQSSQSILSASVYKVLTCDDLKEMI